MTNLVKSVFLLSLVVATTAMAQETRTEARDLRSTEQPWSGSIAVGPAFAAGLKSKNALYDVAGAVNYNFNQEVSGKVFADMAFAEQSKDEYFYNFGAGANYAPMAWSMRKASPYVSADAGYGSTRNAGESKKDALAVGAAGGMRFLTQALNWDLQVHYAVLTAQNEGTTPSVVAVRGGVNF